MPYLAFLAPGLLASTAMQSAAFESTFPIMGGLVWNRTFHAMYATPISGRDIALGQPALDRGPAAADHDGLHDRHRAVRRLRVAARRVRDPGRGADRASPSPRPIAAFSATQRTVEKFNAIFRFGITPLFLFSGTFYPVDQLPTALQALAWLTPLYHGVELARGLSLGTIGEEPVLALVHLVDPHRVLPRRDVVRDPHDLGAAGARMTALRITPMLIPGSRRSLRLVERNLYVYSHTWLVILSGFFEPLFYLLSIGFGLGALIGTVPGPGGEPIPYQLFVAPALLASASMNGAINESTFNFFFKLNYNKTFTAILSTPLSPGDIAVGELLWALIRGGLYAIGFVVVMVVLGLVVSPWVILAFPAALLVGFAFGAVGMAATSFMRTWQDFDLIQLVILPLFLFSATFYPIETYPPALQVVVKLTPLYQGVDLIRSLTVGAISPILLVHVAYLLDHGPRRAGRRVAAARPAAAQVGPGGGVDVSDATPVDRAALAALTAEIVECRRCPRLVAWREQVAREKVARFREDDVLGPAAAGVRGPGGADPDPWAGARGPRREPDGAGLHGRRVGRLPVGGAASGRAGGSAGSRRADDGLTLTDAYIAAAVRCAPPANKPIDR